MVFFLRQELEEAVDSPAIFFVASAEEFEWVLYVGRTMSFPDLEILSSYPRELWSRRE